MYILNNICPVLGTSWGGQDTPVPHFLHNKEFFFQISNQNLTYFILKLFILCVESLQ